MAKARKASRAFTQKVTRQPIKPVAAPRPNPVPAGPAAIKSVSHASTALSNHRALEKRHQAAVATRARREARQEFTRQKQAMLRQVKEAEQITRRMNQIAARNERRKLLEEQRLAKRKPWSNPRKPPVRREKTEGTIKPVSTLSPEERRKRMRAGGDRYRQQVREIQRGYGLRYRDAQALLREFKRRKKEAERERKKREREAKRKLKKKKNPKAWGKLQRSRRKKPWAMTKPGQKRPGRKLGAKRKRDFEYKFPFGGNKKPRRNRNKRKKSYYKDPILRSLTGRLVKLKKVSDSPDTWHCPTKSRRAPNQYWTVVNSGGGSGEPLPLPPTPPPIPYPNAPASVPSPDPPSPSGFQVWRVWQRYQYVQSSGAPFDTGWYFAGSVFAAPGFPLNYTVTNVTGPRSYEHAIFIDGWCLRGVAGFGPIPSDSSWRSEWTEGYLVLNSGPPGEPPIGDYPGIGEPWVPVAGSGWECDCPDFTKQAARANAPLYFSEMSAGNWVASNAGAIAASDPPSCKHIKAAKREVYAFMPELEMLQARDKKQRYKEDVKAARKRLKDFKEAERQELRNLRRENLYPEKYRKQRGEKKLPTQAYRNRQERAAKAREVLKAEYIAHLRSLGLKPRTGKGAPKDGLYPEQRIAQRNYVKNRMAELRPGRESAAEKKARLDKMRRKAAFEGKQQREILESIGLRKPRTKPKPSSKPRKPEYNSPEYWQADRQVRRIREEQDRRTLEKTGMSEGIIPAAIAAIRKRLGR